MIAGGVGAIVFEDVDDGFAAGCGEVDGEADVAEFGADGIYELFEFDVGIFDLVDDDHARQATFEGDLHEAASCGFYAAGCVDYDDDGFDGGDAGDGLAEEVSATGGVDEMDVVAFEIEVHEGWVDAVFVMAFFVGPVADCVAFFDGADAFGDACGEEEAFGDGGLSCTTRTTQENVADD